MDLSKYITSLTVETEYLPPIMLSDPFAPGKPNPLLQRLKPRVTLTLADGLGDPVVLTPYGAPGPSKWPVVQAFGIAAIVGVVVGIAYLVKRG